MPMDNLIEYISNFSKRTGSLGFYSKNEATNFNDNIANIDHFKSFKYKINSLENTEADGDSGILKNATIAVPLKYFSNFWRSLEIPLIVCKVELKLNWTKYCVLFAAGANNTNDNPNNIIFTIKDTKLYVPVVTLSTRENPKLLNLYSKEFGRSVNWNEYKAKSENKNETSE